MLRRHLLPIGLALTFLIAIAVAAQVIVPDGPLKWLIVIAAAAAGYMALNVGANDVANNVGPAVGAKAITLGAALVLAAIFDLAGALMAGGEVIDTVATQLIHFDLPPVSATLVMVSALIAAAGWVNISTSLGAPISTTHAIIGAIVGATVTAAGVHAVDWRAIGSIAVTWLMSPLVGGLLAAAIHTVIRRLVTRQHDKVAAAQRWVPIFCGLMSGVFAGYLSTKVGHAFGWSVMAIGSGFAVLAWLIATPWVNHRSQTLENRKKHVARLFRPPLIIAAALLSFAHGANDVANAIAPLVAILSVTEAAPGVLALPLPAWVALIGALGLALGITLFGPRVIRTVGEQITKLNEIRAFCVALAAAFTLLLAATFGMPISSTHVAVGAVFGVGFLREYLAMRNMRSVPTETYFVDETLLNDTPEQAIARERRYNRRYLVRRLKVARIGAAWVITLPVAAILGSAIYLGLSAAIG